jgi:hypothetical protein
VGRRPIRVRAASTCSAFPWRGDSGSGGFRQVGRAQNRRTTAGIVLGIVAIVVSVVMMVIAYNVLT